MEDMIGIAAFIVVALAVVLVFVFAYFNEKKRAEAMRGLAASMNFEFSDKEDGAGPGADTGFHLFNQGHGRKSRNVMRGETQGTTVAVFDYQYTIGSGKNSTTYKQSVALFESDDLDLPAFALRPEHFFHKIGAAFGCQDIDFDDHPDFSKRYLLRGDDEDSIRTAFSQDVLSYYEHHPKLCTEGGGNGLVFYRQGKRAKPEEIGAFLQEAVEVFALFKRG